MTTYLKPAVRSAWAQNAGPADLVDPGDSFAAAGWLIGTKPPRQYMNWLENFSFNGIRYLCQNGIVDYDATETYQIGAVVMGPDFLVYQSITNNNLGNTPASSPTQWGPLQVPTAGSGDNSHNAASTAWVTTYFQPKTASIGLLPGQLVNGQVPLSVVQQWQGSLAINFTQLTGSIANAQVPVGAVTQWQASLSIAWGQITGTKNADQLQGVIAGVLGSYTFGALARYDNNGYLYDVYTNQASPNGENPTVSQIMVTNGADNFLRKCSLAAFKNALAGSQSLASNGYAQLPGGMIIQWITCNPNGGSIIAGLPLQFPHACLAAVATATAVPTTCNITNFNTFQIFISNSGGQAFVIAVGF